MKNNIVGLKELRLNIQKYASLIECGESFVVLRKSRPIFRIVPPELEDKRENAVDFTKISKNGEAAKEILKELHKLNVAVKALIDFKI
jgi:antitoxin (DNA-binding transcriptional repressor) of toxin-antitoxin stability system